MAAGPSVRSRLGTPYSSYAKPMTHSTCLDCGTTLVSQRIWASMTRAERIQARQEDRYVHAAQGYCARDYQKRRRAGTIRCVPRKHRLPRTELDRLRRLAAG